MTYVAPDTTVVVQLGRPPDEEQVQRAVLRLRTEPGLGAVVLADAALITHRRMLDWVPRGEGEDVNAWLSQFITRLQVRCYDVEGMHVRSNRTPPSTARSAAGRVKRLVLGPRAEQVLLARTRWRRWRFLQALRREAWLIGAPLTLDIARDLVVEPGVRFQVRPQGASVRIASRCSIGGGVVLRLGGELVMGPGVEIRQDCSLNVKGRLHLEGRNMLGRGSMLHADGTMVLEWGATASEYVSVLDSHHEFDGSLVRTLDQGLELADVTIGAGALLGAKSTVLPGVRVGRSSLIGAHSVVTKDVPDGWIAVGSPARALRPVALS